MALDQSALLELLDGVMRSAEAVILMRRLLAESDATQLLVDAEEGDSIHRRGLPHQRSEARTTQRNGHHTRQAGLDRDR